jgi:type III secretory pathway lipoprotein EscJ
MRWLVLAIALVACDGDAWSPRAERERAAKERAAELAAHLETIPGVAEASVVLDLPYADPLAVEAPAAPPRASVVLALEPGADTAAAEVAATRAVAGAIAGAEVTVITAAPAPGEALVAVGPFRVAAGSRTPLLAALAAALLAIAGLAAWIAIAGYRRATTGRGPTRAGR